MAPRAEPLTMAEAIAERARAVKEVFEDSKLVERIRDFAHSVHPHELKRKLIDHFKDKARRLEGRRDEESRRMREWYERLVRRIEATEWIGKLSAIRDPTEETLITGSDASHDMIELLFYAGYIPLTIRAGVVSYVCVPLEFKVEEPRWCDPIRKPEFPFVGSPYLREFTYEPTGEEEGGVINTILMNTVQFMADKELILDQRPGIHFHDGRLIPPHPHYLDFKPTTRRKYLWRCFSSAVELKREARDNKCELVGVVKKTHPEAQVLAHVVSMLLEEFMGRDYSGLLTDNELAAASLLLGEEQVSWVIVTNLKSVYLPPEEEKSARRVLEDDYDLYIRRLEELSYATFYCVHRAGTARYDMFNYGDLIARRDRIASYANAIASPLTGHQYEVGRHSVAVPSVVSVADSEARAWAKRVADIIAEHIRHRLAG